MLFYFINHIVKKINHIVKKILFPKYFKELRLKVQTFITTFSYICKRFNNKHVNNYYYFLTIVSGLNNGINKKVREQFSKRWKFT